MRLASLLLLTLLAGCGKDDADDPDAIEPATGCDPVDPALCALPFPSSYFEAPASTASGVTVDFGPDSLPVNRDGVPMRPDAWNRLDGFSTLTPILTWIEDLSLDGTAGHDDIGRSLQADSPTVLVDASTGERVPHFVELDVSGPEGSKQLFVLRPAAPLAHGTTYVVGLRGLAHVDGAPVQPTEAFAALRDGTSTNDGDIERQRERFEQVVFPALEQAGVDRGSLQRAWSFTTISVESSLGDVLHMRDDALARLPEGGPTYVIDAVEDGDCEEGPIARTVEGRVTVPRYTVEPQAPTRLARGDDGLPVYVADVQRPFLVRIPCSLALDPDPSRKGMILQYGHGMLGNRGEARTGWLSQFLDESGWVAFAMDWTGMSEADVAPLTLMLATDVSDFDTIPERSQQGFIEKVYGLKLMMGPLATDPALTDFTSLGERDAPVVDPQHVGYYGISQGAIMGSAYTAISPDIERAVFGVGGMPYSLLLSRSANFAPFFLIFKNKYDDQREIALIIAMMQTLWDPGEGSGYAHFLGEQPLPGARPKRVLHQAAIGDPQVTTLGAHVGARAWGAVSVAPAVRPIWGVEEVSAPIEGSALVEWFYEDGSIEPYENVPPSKSGDTHECQRREPAGQAQIRTFLETGVVEQFCDGVCVGDRAAIGCD